MNYSKFEIKIIYYLPVKSIATPFGQRILFVIIYFLDVPSMKALPIRSTSTSVQKINLKVIEVLTIAKNR